MKKLLIAALVALISLPALAADLAAQTIPVKAVFANPCMVATATTPLSCSGFYVGGGISGQGSNANIIGNGIQGSVFAGGMVPDADVGYQYMQGNWMFGAELRIGYAVGSNVAVTNVNGFRIAELAKVGGNLSAMLGSQVPITVPPSLANSVLAPYAAVGSTQWQMAGAWASGLTSGAGIAFDIGPRWWGDLSYLYTDFKGAKVNGITVQNDQSLRIGFNYKLN